MSATQHDQVPPKVAAEIIGKSVRWLMRMRGKRKSGPPYYRIGGRITYRREELKAWLETCRRE